MLRTILKPFLKLQFQIRLKSTMASERICQDARKIFASAIKSVEPENLIEGVVVVNESSIFVKEETYAINRNVYIVGFGKAVLGMAIALERKLKHHLVSGIISVPVGTINTGNFVMKQDSLVQIYEGARNNIPDEKSLYATLKITELVSSLKDTDLLFILISGGGSALLSAPKPPLTLSEKQKIISLMSLKGASIQEINSVRKRLSTVKGGGLASLAKPAKVVSLILSDIIGDPLSFIASGPTVKNTDNLSAPLIILEKYNLTSELSHSTRGLLAHDLVDSEQCFNHVTNFIIGNNETALRAAAKSAENLHYASFVITNELQGHASEVGKLLISMIQAVIARDDRSFERMWSSLHLPSSMKSIFQEAIKEYRIHKRICLIFGGETTVVVKGTGVGGRNQELALSASLQLNASEGLPCLLLSAGTDGIDGPTDAAGAIATSQVVEAARAEKIEVTEFLENNDSHTFFKSVQDGKWLVKTGHTGTNVMDIVLILMDSDINT